MAGSHAVTEDRPRPAVRQTLTENGRPVSPRL